MSLIGIVDALWPTFRRILLRIGRWVARVLLSEGATFLARYMRQRVEVFRKRLRRVLARRHAEWRPRFLRSRIQRWLRAAAWLDQQATALRSGSVCQELDRRADGLPEDSDEDNERGWRRLQTA